MTCIIVICDCQNDAFLVLDLNFIMNFYTRKKVIYFASFSQRIFQHLFAI